MDTSPSATDGHFLLRKFVWAADGSFVMVINNLMACGSLTDALITSTR